MATQKGGRTRNSDPHTSHDAGEQVDVSHLENIVVGALRGHSAGLTTHEIEDATGLEWGSVTPRMVPLEEKGIIERARVQIADEWVVETRVPRGHRRAQIIWRLRSEPVSATPRNDRISRALAKAKFVNHQ
jgi:DNA-binding Lrp family transcriptional regulator